MKKVIVILALALSAVAAHASDSSESFSVNGKVFETKAQAIRYIVASGKRLQVIHTRCEILTNKLTLKACPKTKVSAFENEQFSGLKAE